MKQNTLNNTQLPTEEEFKKIAWKLKEEQGIKLTAALNQLSIKYGFKSFNAIKGYRPTKGFFFQQYLKIA